MTFAIENIRSDDPLLQARSVRFLQENPDPGVRLRPQKQLDLALNTGQGIAVQRDGEICAVSLVYQFDVPPNGPVHYEIGTMRVTAESYGLQTFLAKLHMVQIYLEDDATRGEIFAVVTPDTASERNMTVHAGMAPWTPPVTLELLRAVAGVPFNPSKSVLRADDAAIRRAFDDLRSMHESGTVFHAPKRGEKVDVSLGWFEPPLLGHGP